MHKSYPKYQVEGSTKFTDASMLASSFAHSKWVVTTKENKHNTR